MKSTGGIHAAVPPPARQVTNFEFSNESFNIDYNGQASASQYATALASWGPQLKSILPSMRLGANGPTYTTSIGAVDRAANSNTYWWKQAWSRHAHLGQDRLAEYRFPRKRMAGAHHCWPRRRDTSGLG